MIWPVSPAWGKILLHVVHPDILFLAGNLVVSTVFFLFFLVVQEPLDRSFSPTTHQTEKWKVPLADELIWVLLQALLGSLVIFYLFLQWCSSSHKSLHRLLLVAWFRLQAYNDMLSRFLHNMTLCLSGSRGAPNSARAHFPHLGHSVPGPTLYLLFELGLPAQTSSFLVVIPLWGSWHLF